MSRMTVIAEPGTHSIVTVRDFDAPRHLVFRALTDPALVARWWGPNNVTTIVDRMDVQPGGLWRYVHRSPDGSEDAFHGVYHDIIAPERLIFTFEWEGLPGHVALETVTLEERDGRTRIIDASVFQTVEDRDGMLQSGMEEGANDSWDRLEEIIRSL